MRKSNNTQSVNTLKEFSIASVSALTPAIIDVLNAHGKEHGLSFNLTAAKVGPARTALTIMMVLDAAIGKQVERDARILGINPKWIGQKVTSQRSGELTITGIDLSKPKFPIQAVNANGKPMGITVDFVRREMEAQDAVKSDKREARAKAKAPIPLNDDTKTVVLMTLAKVCGLDEDKRFDAMFDADWEKKSLSLKQRRAIIKELATAGYVAYTDNGKGLVMPVEMPEPKKVTGKAKPTAKAADKPVRNSKRGNQEVADLLDDVDALDDLDVPAKRSRKSRNSKPAAAKRTARNAVIEKAAYAVGDKVQYRRPRVGWVKAEVVQVTRKDLVIQVAGARDVTKIALKYLGGDNSPIKAGRRTKVAKRNATKPAAKRGATRKTTRTAKPAAKKSAKRSSRMA